MKKNKYPKVSVIMNCFNGEKFLHESISSVIKQTYKNWEIIFVDNESTDNSIKIAKSFNDKRIKIFKTKKFETLYKARNLAISKSIGKYICFLDTDDWWHKNKLFTQINFIQKNKNIKFIFSDCFIYDEKLNFKKLHFKKKIISGKITQQLLDDYNIGILTVMIERDLFKKKKFNDKYNIIGDFDLFIHLSINENLYCLNKPLAFYRRHENNFSKKRGMHVDELRLWLKMNSKKLKKLGFKLFYLKIFYYRLFIINMLKFLGV